MQAQSNPENSISACVSSLPAEGFARLPQVLNVVPVKRSTLWLWVKNGQFPRPVKLGGTTAWPVEAVRAWIAERNQQAA
jgi:prophage regulatory protein